jgi:PAS domain S-box-containing protein
MPEQTLPHDTELALLQDELERYRFITKLDDAIRHLDEQDDIVGAATGMLREHLHVDQCICALIDHPNGRVEDLMACLRSALGPAFAHPDDPVWPVVVRDVEADVRFRQVVQSCLGLGIRAAVCVPVRKGGQLAGYVVLAHSVPRQWRENEVALSAAVAERCWAGIERARMSRELRSAEQRIRASHDYLRLLINSSEEGFYSVDRDGVTIMCNAAFLKMLGFEREEDAVGKKLHGVIHHLHPDGSHYDVCDCPIYQAAQFGTPAHIEDELFFRLDGSGFPVEYRARPVWQDGELQGAVCTFVDLTERRKTEQALQQSEAHLQSLFAQTGAGISETDLSGRLFRMNERFCDIVGRSREELLTMRMHEFTHPDDLARNLPLFEQVVTIGVPFEIEKRYVRPDGRIVWVNNTVSPVRSSDGGAVDSILAISVDISERKRVEEALREADRRKDEFLAMLAHELRNPMAPIRAAADLMEVTQLEPARLKRTSQIIARQVKHMTGLVDDLLDVSRVTRGLIKLEQADLDVKQVINDALEQVRPLIEEKRHHLTVDLDPAPAHVLGDQKRLVQILTNLLNNATKYTPAGGNIHVTMQASEEAVRLHVADNGVGIPADLQPRIFDLFAQAERSPDRSQGGLGIGLALVKSLVELHGGSVRCESEGAGKGSDFTVTLPRIARDAGHPAGRDEDSLKMSALNQRRILIVDDNVDAAQILAMLLEAAGHEVVVEHGSKHALERVKSWTPDVCILDIGLPEIDGNELARLLRSRDATAATVLIALTGYGHEQDRKQALEAGFDHFLVKPADAATVLDLVSK